MKLGQNQQALVDALRSGKYEQGKGYLRRGNKYCFGGVACEVLGVDQSKVDDIHHDPKDQIYLYGDILSTEPDMAFYGAIPPRTGNALKLRDSIGYIRTLGISLVDMNDGDYTFPELADKIEEYAEDIFTEES